MFSRKISFLLLLLLGLVIALGCSDDNPTEPPPAGPSCAIEPSTLNFGAVVVGQTKDLSFTITNNGSERFQGMASENCDHFEITGGTAPYDLGPGESHAVMVRFAPTTVGTHACTVMLSDTVCSDVPVMGSGAPATLIAARDNTLYESDTGEWSNGGGNFMFAGRTALNGPSGEPVESRRAIFAFDLTSIPQSATVDSVVLLLTMVRPVGASNGTRLTTLHKLTADWGEGTTVPLNTSEGGGEAAEVGDATWIHTFLPNQMWATPGGDYVATGSASTLVANEPGSTVHRWGSTSTMVSDVEDWIQNPLTNFGWILIGDESTDKTAKRFATRENFDAAKRPMLMVYFSL